MSAPLCNAPSAALYFDTWGDVRACCRNRGAPYGNVGRSTLAEIWGSAIRHQLIEEVEGGELPPGCSFCAPSVSGGGAAGTYARHFDRFDPQPWPQFLDFAISNTCNLQCTMCSGEFSSSIRSQREGLAPHPFTYPERFFEEIGPFLQHAVRLHFGGGEPFLARPTQRIWDLVLADGLRPQVSVVTNGTRWGDDVAGYVRDLRMDVSLSIDTIDPEHFAAIRVGADLATVLETLDHLQDATRRAGSTLRLSSCLMVDTWQGFGDLLRMADDRDLDVAVSLVVDPPSRSVLKLPRAELEQVTAALERQGDALRERLGRNRPVWDREVARLRSVLDHGIDRPIAAPVALRSPRSAPAAHEGADIEDEATLMDWGDGGLVTITTSGPTASIEAIDPDPAEVFGVDLRGLLGRPVAEVMYALEPIHGAADGVTILRKDDGLLDQVVRFRHPSGRSSRVRTITRADDGGRTILRSALRTDPMAR